MKERPDSRRTLSPDNLRERGWTVPGIIIRRGRSYALKIYAGRENGKKRDKWLTFKTYAEAEAAQRELASHVLAHSAGLGLYGSPRERLGTYLSDWLARHQLQLAPRTAERYDTFVEQVTRDAIGTIPLARLSPRALEAYYARRLAAGLSPTTVNHHHRMLSKALGDAVRQDLIVRNPAGAAQAPKRARPRPEVWTEAQTLLFLSEARATSPYHTLYLFIVATGCRVGEALGLTWKSVNLRGRTVQIEQNLQRTKGGGYICRGPKTQRSTRTIAISPEVVTALAERQPKDGFVFAQSNGKPLHANNIRQRDVRRICVKLGLPWRRALHNLRHAHASYLLQRGVSVKVVQERLGHSTAAFTLGTYAHVLEGMQEQAAQAVSAILGGQGNGCYPPATLSGHAGYARTADK